MIITFLVGLVLGLADDILALLPSGGLVVTSGTCPSGLYVCVPPADPTSWVGAITGWLSLVLPIDMVAVVVQVLVTLVLPALVIYAASYFFYCHVPTVAGTGTQG